MTAVAEERVIEAAEFTVRQFNRYVEWVWNRYQPRLLVDYFPMIDTIDHSVLGLVREPGAPKGLKDFRRRIYELVDRRIAFLESLLGPEDTIIVASDHGMAVITKVVKMNLAFQKAGLLAVDEAGSIDQSRTKIA